MRARLPTSVRSPCWIEDIESEATQASIGMIEAHTLINGLFGLLPELIQIHYVRCLVCGPKLGILVPKSIRNCMTNALSLGKLNQEVNENEKSIQIKGIKRERRKM